ncbi:hypothetical protein AAY473_003815 [Plecturocebus cupreus]
MACLYSGSRAATSTRGSIPYQGRLAEPAFPETLANLREEGNGLHQFQVRLLLPHDQRLPLFPQPQGLVYNGLCLSCTHRHIMNRHVTKSINCEKVLQATSTTRQALTPSKMPTALLGGRLLHNKSLQSPTGKCPSPRGVKHQKNTDVRKTGWHQSLPYLERLSAAIQHPFSLLEFQTSLANTERLHLYKKNLKISQGMGAHICRPSYSGQLKWKVEAARHLSLAELQPKEKGGK